jgi:hypothetical protein
LSMSMFRSFSHRCGDWASTSCNAVSRNSPNGTGLKSEIMSWAVMGPARLLSKCSLAHLRHKTIKLQHLHEEQGTKQADCARAQIPCHASCTFKRGCMFMHALPLFVHVQHGLSETNPQLFSSQPFKHVSVISSTRGVIQTRGKRLEQRGKFHCGLVSKAQREPQRVAIK